MDSRSPAPALLLGLVVTLAAVVGVSWYLTRQISGLRALQTDLADRNRVDSLQLLRIQNDLNSLGLAMRDMLDTSEPYPLTAWSAQFARIRRDLDDAIAREAEAGGARRTPEQSEYLTRSLAQFWDASDRIFALAAGGHQADARDQVRLSLQARQDALTTAVARLLAANNASEEQTAAQVREIYARVQRQVYVFLGATFVVIALTSLYLIRSNRRLFARLSSLSNDRRGLAQQLIAARESTLREIARELHDEFGQVLTAMGSMLGRAGRHAPEGSPLRGELREVAEIAQTTLENMRGLSQTLHPSILEDAGLERTVDWYLSTIERQLGLTVSYDRPATPIVVDSEVGIQVYRVLQESLSNVARHSGVRDVRVRLRSRGGVLELDVEDHGRGLPASTERRGLGIVAMRERAALVGGTLEFVRPRDGGTLIRLRVPIAPAQASHV
ncbi:MAG TPA: histidine kinase [Vicinamibacterales bacterium]|nr:histidine kinase [Vicinamibacterales bacterium]